MLETELLKDEEGEDALDDVLQKLGGDHWC
jgi:hypothetical protein